MAKGPLAVRWGDWTLDEPQAGAVGHRRGGARERRHGALGRRHQARLPLARRARQPDRLGRRAHARCPRSRRASARPSRPGARADPAGPLPVRARPRRRAPRLVLGARRARWSTPTSRSAARGRAARRRCPAGSSPRRDWAERVAAAHAEGYAVVAGAIEWDGGLLTAVHALSSRTSRARAACPGSPTRCSARRSLDGIELERLAGRRGLPAFAAPAPTRAVDLRRPDRPHRDPRGASELDRDPVVDAAEDERAERERDDRGDREVDDVRSRGALAEPERVANRVDRRGDEVPPAQQLEQLWWSCTLVGRSRSARGSASGRTTAGAPRRGCARCRGRARSAQATSERDARDEADEERPPSGIASQTVERAAGMNTSESTIRIASISANVTSWVATTENGDELAREAHLPDQLGAVEQRARRRLERGREEEPAREAREQVERVVRGSSSPFQSRLKTTR